LVKLYLDRKLSREEFHRKIFDGDLLLYRNSPGTIALCEYAKTLMHEAFGTKDPEMAQFDMDVEDFVPIVGALKSKFTNDEHTKKLIKNILIEYGCDINKTYFDVPRLRVVSHGGYLSAGVGYAYKAHRDTWYAAPHSQINWWMSVSPLEAPQVMTFYPKYWDQPCKNASAKFDYGEWCDVGRKVTMSQIKKDTRNHPIPLEELYDRDGLKIITDAAEPIVFSAAHLHATSPNDSGRTRFSIDWRTIDEEDIISNNAAKNIDDESRGTTISDFIRASDFTPISKELMDKCSD
jgi:hypothetical protein